MKFHQFIKASIFSVIAAGLFMVSTNANANTIHQHRNALANYSTDYRFVNNHNYGFTQRYNHNYYQGSPNYINYASGNDRVHFSHPIEIDDGNPQSMIITPHKIAYILYNNGGNNNQLSKFNLNHVYDGQVSAEKTSGNLKLGHGQGLAYNPKAHQIWCVTNSEGSSNHPTLAEINPRTLKINHQISFPFEDNSFGDVLTFDKKGNAYNCVRTFGGNAPVGSLKLYKGKITTHSVHFHMLRQGIKRGPGYIMQNMNYNPSNNRIYFISDSVIMSAPVSRLNHLRPRDVHTSKFTHHREFEDVAFYNHRGYLLLNDPERIMISNRNF